MRSAKKLVKGRKYEINYTGPEEYCHFNGIGEYTGKIDDAMVGSLEDNNIYYGFILDNIKGSTQEDPNWFPIESIHELDLDARPSNSC